MTRVRRTDSETYLLREIRRNRVVTVTPDALHCIQVGAIIAIQVGAIADPRRFHLDGTIIAPRNANSKNIPYPEVHLGQLVLNQNPGFDSNLAVKVTMTLTNPALILLDSPAFLSSDLYGRDIEGESDHPSKLAATLKRVILFNRAVARLMKEAELEPRILHLYDWPTTLTLLYLEQEDLSIGKCLFTYPDARYQGLFPKDLLPWLGLPHDQAPIDLEYYCQLSFAKLGIQRANRIITFYEGQLGQVRSNNRPGGGDFGLFSELFNERHAQGDVDSLGAELFAKEIVNTNMLLPKPSEIHIIKSMLDRYNDEYAKLEPRISDEELFVVETGVRDPSWGSYSNLLIVTLSGGLAQRFDFNIRVTKDTITLPKNLFKTAQNVQLAQAGATSREKNNNWVMTPAKFESWANPQISSDPFIAYLVGQIKERLASGDEKPIGLAKGFFVLPGEDVSIFEFIARSLDSLSQKVQQKIIWGIMLSSDNKEVVRLFFQAALRNGRYFDLLGKDQVLFDVQRNYPIVTVIDQEKKKLDIVVDNEGRIMTASCGHGGFYEVAANMLKELEQLGRRPNFVLAANIDNLLLGWQFGNPDFIAGWLGHHVSNNYDITCLASKKIKPKEPMGVFALTEDGPRVIEYDHPNYTARIAFVYNSSRGRIYFVNDTESNLFLVVPAAAIDRIASLVTPALDKVLFPETDEPQRRYQLLELQQLSGKEKLQSVDNNFDPTGETLTLADLGEVKMTYRQGNTNAFLFRSSFVSSVRTANNPEETYKYSNHPLGYKIESELFGPIQLVEHFGPHMHLMVGFVEEERRNCFAPLKTPDDLDPALKALSNLQKRFHGLKNG